MRFRIKPPKKAKETAVIVVSAGPCERSVTVAVCAGAAAGSVSVQGSVTVPD